MCVLAVSFGRNVLLRRLAFFFHHLSRGHHLSSRAQCQAPCWFFARPQFTARWPLALTLVDGRPPDDLKWHTALQTIVDDRPPQAFKWRMALQMIKKAGVWSTAGCQTT